ncbi:hypothetical protein BJ165DRAFT_933240 [Panaeolus papilionaceus]|nr:hypothetical protein BJ165DRAFT_933240 [Panaeolus papilionaceus]
MCPFSLLLLSFILVLVFAYPLRLRHTFPVPVPSFIVTHFSFYSSFPFLYSKHPFLHPSLSSLFAIPLRHFPSLLQKLNLKSNLFTSLRRTMTR